jgi:hypothetical protein
MEGAQKNVHETLNENAFLVSEGTERKRKKGIPLQDKGTDGKPEKIYPEPPKGGVFRQYEELEQIVEKIANDFLQNDVFNKSDDDLATKTYEDIIKNGLTYVMASGKEKSRSGLLSICPAVLTAMKLWRELSVEKGKSKIKKDTSDTRLKLMEHIKMGINAMLKIIYRGDNQPDDDDDAPVFDASPFEYDENTFTKGLNGRSYIDSISWAVPVFLKILNLTGKDGTTAFTDKNLRDKAKFLAKWCLNYINVSVIVRTDKEHSSPIGWNYTRLKKPKGAKRSLNFTYAASTIYLSFYTEYVEIVDALRILDRVEELTENDDLKIDISGEYWKNHSILESELKKVEDFCEDIEKEDIDDEEAKDPKKDKERSNAKAKFEKIRDALRVLCKSENIEKLNTFMEFNDDKCITNEPDVENDGSEDDVGAVSRLKWNLENVSADIWNKIGDKIKDKFFYDDHDLTDAKDEAIENGGQTNALFSGLLSIGIILNSAYDEKVKNETNDTEYSKMQDAMLLHIQKTQRFFDDMEEKGNSFDVDTLILRFSQKITDGNEDADEYGPDALSDQALAEQLRKHYIRVNSLTPLLLKTNNIISKYVIKYPQKQMGESLLQISKKRVRDNKTNKILWLWESDGYNAVATYYYVDGIINFYEYYEKYERMYITYYDEMCAKLIDDIQYTTSVRKYCERRKKEFEEQKNDYIKKLEEKDTEIENLNKQLSQKNVGNELVNILYRVIKDYEFFYTPEFYKKILEGMRKCLAEELVMKRYKSFSSKSKDSLEKLKKPIAINQENIDTNGEIFSLLQALAADIILPSAVEAKKNSEGRVGNLGSDEGLNQKWPPDAVLKGGTLLINDGLINNWFASAFSKLGWEPPK